MNSTFTGLYIATSGLYTSQGAMAVATNNTSNASTPGYSRQVVNQSAAGPAAVYNGHSILGNGAQINSVDRERDAQLDQKYWGENGLLGEWQTKNSSLTEMEEVLGEPSDNGFSTTMNDFYSALESLGKNAGDDSARKAVQAKGSALCQYLNETSQRLTKLQEDANSSVKITVSEINSYAKQIADLNDRIYQAKAVGTTANDLEDQRGLLIDKLSKLVKVNVTETTTGTQANGTENKTLAISINGQMLLNGGTTRQLTCSENAATGMYEITWQDSGQAFTPGSGTLKATLDLRDGTGADYKGIPYYINQLDKFARTFAEAFNEGIFADGTTHYPGHAGGVGSDGSTGIRFFTYEDAASPGGKSSADFMASGADMSSRYANITAANISLSADIQTDTKKIAAASAAGESGNNENVNQLIKLCKDTDLFNKGTPEDFMNSIIATLGTDSSYATRLSGNQASFVKNINDRRTSVSGVDTNEETANITKYQQAYSSSAHLINVWDELFKETISLISE